MKRILLLGTVLAGIGLTASAARATPYTYGFADEYYVTTQAEFNTLFGVGTAGYTTGGIYDETTTTPTKTVAKLSSTGVNALPGEYTQNDNGSGIVLNGWTNSALNEANGSKINYVISNPAAISLQYKTGMTGALTGGTLTAMDLISMNLSTLSGATSYIIEGLLGGTSGTVEYAEQVCTNGNQYAVAAVNGTCGAYTPTATVPLNWNNIDTVEFGYESGGVFHTGWPSGGTLDMTNIVIGPVIPAPEPASVALLGAGLTGLAFARRRRQSRV